jgi:nitronate monooxygenase
VILAPVVATGADGGSVCTAFLAAPEAAEVPAAYKRCIVESDGEDTVFATLYDDVAGMPWPKPIGVRTRRTSHTDAWPGRQAEVEEQLDELRAEPPQILHLEHFDPEVSPMLYGQSAAWVDAARPAAEVVQSLQSDAGVLPRQRLTDVVVPG